MLYCCVFSVYELLVENLAADPALLDGDLLSSPSLSSSSGRRLRFDLSSSLRFRCTNSRAIGLVEDEAVKSQSSALLDVCFHWSSQIVSRVQCQYAFMLLDIDVATLGRQADSLRPLDIAYAARLCCYENQTTRPQHTSQSSASRLFHVQATDEELWMLFADPTDQLTHHAQHVDAHPLQKQDDVLASPFLPAMLAPQSQQTSWSSPPPPAVACTPPYSASPTTAPLSSSPPLDTALCADGTAPPSSVRPPSPSLPFPILVPATGSAHSLRSISTSGRSINSSFSDLPHFSHTHTTVTPHLVTARLQTVDAAAAAAAAHAM